MRKCGREEKRIGEGGEGGDAILRMLQKILKVHPNNILKFSSIQERML